MISLFFLVLFFSLSYAIGSISSGVIAGRLLKGIDIRSKGSGNAGATNAYRVLGLKAGLFVLFFDIFKGFFAAYFTARWGNAGGLLWPDTAAFLGGCFAVLGHIYPVFTGFKGGKGVGTIGGMLLAVHPLSLTACLTVFILVFRKTRIASASSLAAAITAPVFFYLMKGDASPVVSAGMWAVPFVVAVTHRENIKRLVKGDENRFT